MSSEASCDNCDAYCKFGAGVGTKCEKWVPGNGICKLTVEEYDALDRVRSSHLKTIIDESPLHLRHELDEGEERNSDALAIGTAIHAAVLEPEVYAREVVVYPGASRRSVAYESFALRYRGKIILLEKEQEQVKAAADAVRKCYQAAQFLTTGRPEMSVLWTDPETGVKCKARPDWLDERDHPVLVGLKTSRDAGPDKFARFADDYLYQLSWAMYRDGYYRVTGIHPQMIEIVVEKTPPYDVVVYTIGDDVIEAGETIYRSALSTYATCQVSGKWPGKGGGEVRELELKPWARGVPQYRDLEEVRFGT